MEPPNSKLLKIKEEKLMHLQNRRKEQRASVYNENRKALEVLPKINIREQNREGMTNEQKRIKKLKESRPPFNRFVKAKHTGFSPYTSIPREGMLFKKATFNFKMKQQTVPTQVKTNLASTSKSSSSTSERANKSAKVPLVPEQSQTKESTNKVTRQKVKQKTSVLSHIKVPTNYNLRVTRQSVKLQKKLEVKHEDPKQKYFMEKIPTQEIALKKELEKGAFSKKGTPQEGKLVQSSRRKKPLDSTFVKSPFDSVENLTKKIDFQKTPCRSSIDDRITFCEKDLNEPENGGKFQRERLIREKERLTNLSNRWDLLRNDVPLWAAEEIDSVVGLTRLLVRDRCGKFEQFEGLITEAENTNNPAVQFSDLDGFWELMFLEVEKLDKKFIELEKNMEHNWVLLENEGAKTVKKKEKQNNKKSKKPVESKIKTKLIALRKNREENKENANVFNIDSIIGRTNISPLLQSPNKVMTKSVEGIASESIEIKNLRFEILPVCEESVLSNDGSNESGRKLSVSSKMNLMKAEKSSRSSFGLLALMNSCRTKSFGSPVTMAQTPKSSCKGILKSAEKSAKSGPIEGVEEAQGCSKDNDSSLFFTPSSILKPRQKYFPKRKVTFLSKNSFEEVESESKLTGMEEDLDVALNNLFLEDETKNRKERRSKKGTPRPPKSSENDFEDESEEGGDGVSNGLLTLDLPITPCFTPRRSLRLQEKGKSPSFKFYF